MADETVTMWRCVWLESGHDRAQDFKHEATAERHARWLGRRTPAVKAHVYAIKVYLEESA